MDTSYRITHKGWDFRDDCKKFILFEYLYSRFTATVLQFHPLYMTIYMTKSSVQNLSHGNGMSYKPMRVLQDLKNILELLYTKF